MHKIKWKRTAALALTAVTMFIGTGNVVQAAEVTGAVTENTTVAVDGTVTPTPVEPVTPQPMPPVVDEQALYPGTYLNTNKGKPVILDLDFCTDVDDVCAVRIATELADQGQITLKAVGLSTVSNTEGIDPVTAMQGLLHADGYSHVPVGSSAANNYDTSPYWGLLAGYGGAKPAESAVRVYRRVLAESPERVDIITTGYLSNIKALLESQPDDISPLTGFELVAQKAGQLYVTGGTYPTGFDNNFWATDDAKVSASYVCKNYPSSIIFFTNKIGGPMICGKALQDTDTYRKDPVTKSLDAFGTDSGRAAWDPFSTLVGSMGSFGMYNLTLTRVDVTVDPLIGKVQFTDNPMGRHYRVVRHSEDLNWYNAQMDMLLLDKFNRTYAFK